MAISKVSAQVIFNFIVADFETAWDCLAARKKHSSGGGNFIFALLAMILLEFACRICKKDTTGKKIADLTNALKKIEKRYFTPLPGPCRGKSGEFDLPGPNPDRHLLAMIFDLVRHGKAHQYHSAIVTLTDGEVDIDLTGAVSNRGLTRKGRRRPKKHLRYKISPSGDLSLYIRTDQLYLDIKKAIKDSGIISRNDIVTDILRPDPKKPYYRFTVADLEQRLNVGKHVRGNW